jgi:TolA-binding protein
VKPQQIVDRLAFLAREAAGDELTAAEQAGLHRLEATLAKRQGRRRGVRVARFAVFAAAACTAAGAFFVMRERALTFEVTHGHVSEGGYIVSESADAEVRFSDRSELGMEAGTRLRVSHLEVRGAQMMLEGGLLHVHIQPRPQASWAIDAGPYIVHVTGTEFDLAWRVDEQTLDLRLHKGSVTVEGPLANGGIQMQAGQHLVASASDGSLSILDERAPKPASFERMTEGDAPGATAAASATAPVSTPDPSARTTDVAARPETVPGAGGHAAAGRGATLGWTARVARGDFDAVIAGAERRGLDRALSEAPLVDLAALADAARYAHRPDVARRALAAQRSRFASSVRARDAAFFLGGIDESQGDESSALQWYDTYLRESPNGAFASQALGRKMMLVQRLRSSDEARAIASDYLARFQEGPYAPNARALLQMR